MIDVTKRLEETKIAIGYLKEAGIAVPEEAIEIEEVMTRCVAAEEVASWAQEVLTALNVGDVKSESPLHKKLREVMIAFRTAKALGGEE